MSSPPGQMWQDSCSDETHNTHPVSVISLKVEHKQHTNTTVLVQCVTVTVPEVKVRVSSH